MTSAVPIGGRSLSTGSPRQAVYALASILTSSPPSNGPCFDKPKGMRR